MLSMGDYVTTMWRNIRFVAAGLWVNLNLVMFSIVLALAFHTSCIKYQYNVYQHIYPTIVCVVSN